VLTVVEAGITEVMTVDPEAAAADADDSEAEADVRDCCAEERAAADEERAALPAANEEDCPATTPASELAASVGELAAPAPDCIVV